MSDPIKLNHGRWQVFTTDSADQPAPLLPTFLRAESQLHAADLVETMELLFRSHPLEHWSEEQREQMSDLLRPIARVYQDVTYGEARP